MKKNLLNGNVRDATLEARKLVRAIVNYNRSVGRLAYAYENPKLVGSETNGSIWHICRPESYLKGARRMDSFIARVELNKETRPVIIYTDFSDKNYMEEVIEFVNRIILHSDIQYRTESRRHLIALEHMIHEPESDNPDGDEGDLWKRLKKVKSL